MPAGRLRMLTSSESYASLYVRLALLARQASLTMSLHISFSFFLVCSRSAGNVGLYVRLALLARQASLTKLAKVTLKVRILASFFRSLAFG